MGVHTRNTNNIKVVMNTTIEDNSIKIVSSPGGTMPKIVKNSPLVKPEPVSLRQEVLTTLGGATRMFKLADYLDTNDEKFYLAPAQLYRYLDVFFGSLLQNNEDKLDKENLEDGARRITFPRISLGVHDGSEFRISFEKYSSAESNRYGLTLFRVDGNREKTVAAFSVYPGNISNNKIEDPRDKKILRGFLKMLEVENGNISANYYRVLKRQPH